MSQSAQSDLQSNVNDLEKAGVPRFHAFLILSVLKLSNDGAASLWWDSRNDSSASAIDTILGIEEADLIQIVLCHHSNVHAGIKDVARDLKRDLATSGTVSLEFFDPQVAPDCTPICFNVASVAIHTGGLPSTAAINACVNFGFQLGSAARDRYKLGNADYLALSESQSFFSGVLDTNTGVTSIRLRQGDLFRNEDRSQITGRLKRACDERRNVWIVITVSQHTFLIGGLGAQQHGADSSGRYVLIDSLPHESLNGRADRVCRQGTMTQLFLKRVEIVREMCLVQLVSLYSYTIPVVPDMYRTPDEVLTRIGQNITTENFAEPLMSPNTSAAINASMAEMNEEQMVLGPAAPVRGQVEVSLDDSSMKPPADSGLAQAEDGVPARGPNKTSAKEKRKIGSAYQPSLEDGNSSSSDEAMNTFESRERRERLERDSNSIRRGRSRSRRGVRNLSASTSPVTDVVPA
ncbi:hypothetical protein THAOC_05422, partial [Thalassiosira oceanica]